MYFPQGRRLLVRKGSGRGNIEVKERGFEGDDLDKVDSGDKVLCRE